MPQEEKIQNGWTKTEALYRTRRANKFKYRKITEIYKVLEEISSCVGSAYQEEDMHKATSGHLDLKLDLSFLNSSHCR